jgi:hypothetical protein
MHRIRRVGLGLALAASVLAGPDTMAQTPTVDGIWEGSWFVRGYSGPLVLKLRQDGERVVGTYDASGGPAGSLHDIRVTGTLTGARLYLEMSSAQRAFAGEVQGNVITGTYWGKRSTKAFTVQRRAAPAGEPAGNMRAP